MQIKPLDNIRIVQGRTFYNPFLKAAQDPD